MRKIDYSPEERREMYRAHNRKVREDHPDYDKVYYQKNREKILARAKQKYRNKVIGNIKA